MRYDHEMRELCPFVTVNHESSVAQASYFYFLGSVVQISVQATSVTALVSKCTIKIFSPLSQVSTHVENIFCPFSHSEI